MSEPFIAEVRMWACNFAPRGWSFCDGQLLPVAQNTALFSLIGTTYGGDGRTTCGLPNLTDRTPMHPGRGPGLSARRLGEKLGATTATLSDAEIPSHDHIVKGLDASGTTASPSNDSYMAQDLSSRAERISYLSSNAQTNTNLSSSTLGASGGSQPHENQQPFLGVNFCIALEGLYPSRS